MTFILCMINVKNEENNIQIAFGFLDVGYQKRMEATTLAIS